MICLCILNNTPPESIFLDKFVIYIYFVGVIWPMRLHYVFVSIDMFVHHITVSELICLCMLYNLIIVCTSYWIFLYISCVWFIIPLRRCYICVWIHMFVNIISMFNSIYLCTLHDLIIVGTPTWLILLCIFPYLLFHCFHPHWPVYTITYFTYLFKFTI